MSSKSLDELRYLFSNFDGISQAEFIEQFPEIWDDAYDIEMGSRYHRLMTSCMLAGWFAAIKSVSDREKKLLDALKTAISYQEKAKNFISHYDDCNALIDEESEGPCECGMETFAHDNYISICLAKEALKEHGG